MKIGRVTAVVSDLHGEQDELHKEVDEDNIQKYKDERKRRKDSPYLNDPIAWDDSESENRGSFE